VLRVTRSFWNVVLAVELADLAFSLDNVVAAVALSRELWVVMTGVFLGIVTMRFAAGIFVRLIARHPVLEAAAYLLVLSIGVGLLMDDLLHIHLNDVQRFATSFGILLLTLLYGRSAAFQRLGRSFIWLKRVLGFVDLLFIYALKPLAWAFALLLALLRALAVVVAPRAPADRDAGERAVRSEASHPDP